MSRVLTLCEVAQKNSRWVWRRLEQFRQYGVTVYEESVTDFFVLNYRRWAPAGFEVKTFTRREEKKSGADWEWWFGSTGGLWLGMRVQAKIINPRTHAFDYLHHNHGIQTTTLIDAAAEKALIPLYCLYTYWARDYHHLHFFKPARRNGEWGVSLTECVNNNETRKSENYCRTNVSIRQSQRRAIVLRCSAVSRVGGCMPTCAALDTAEHRSTIARRCDCRIDTFVRQ